MLRFVFLSSFLFSVFALGGERLPLECESLTDASAPKVRIHFSQGTPSALFIKEPGEKEFQPVQAFMRVINSKNQQGIETFTAVPIGERHDGSSTQCYQKVGTRYEFQFFHRQKLYHMQRAPQFSVTHSNCLLPHFDPHYDQMRCEEVPAEAL